MPPHKSPLPLQIEPVAQQPRPDETLYNLLAPKTHHDETNSNVRIIEIERHHTQHLKALPAPGSDLFISLPIPAAKRLATTTAPGGARLDKPAKGEFPVAYLRLRSLTRRTLRKAPRVLANSSVAKKTCT
jgi:hypothetical protein